MSAHEPPLPPCTPVWRIGGALERADIPALCERLAVRIGGTGSQVIVCDVAGLARPDAVAVEALARLQLTARRLGRRIRLRGASPQLLDLLAFVGLRGVLPLCPEPRASHPLPPARQPRAADPPARGSDALAGQPRWQAEQREQPLVVEEEVEPGDPPA